MPVSTHLFRVKAVWLLPFRNKRSNENCRRTQIVWTVFGEQTEVHISLRRKPDQYSKTGMFSLNSDTHLCIHMLNFQRVDNNVLVLIPVNERVHTCPIHDDSLSDFNFCSFDWCVFSRRCFCSSNVSCSDLNFKIQSVAFRSIATFGARSEPFRSGILSRKTWKLYFKSFLRFLSRTLCTFRLHSLSSTLSFPASRFEISCTSSGPRFRSLLSLLAFSRGRFWFILALFAAGSSLDVFDPELLLLSFLHGAGHLRLITGFSIIVTTSISSSTESNESKLRFECFR